MIQKDEKKILRKHFTKQFFHGNYLMFSLTLMAMFMIAGVNLIVSWLMQELIDTATGVSADYTLLELAGVSVAIVGLLAAAELIRCQSQPRFTERAMRQYKDYVFEQLTKKSIASFSTENTTTYISALSNDLNSIETNYLKRIFSLVNLSVMFVGAIVMMLWYSPVLTLAACGFSIFPVVVSILTGNRLADAERGVSDNNEKFLETVKDSLSGFFVVKSFKAEREILRLFSKRNATLEHSKKRRDALTIIIEMIGAMAGVIAQLGVFLVGAYLAFTGKGVTAGIVIVFVQLMNFIIQPIAVVPDILANRKAANALIDKMVNALNENVRDEGEAIPRELNDAIEFKHVNFTYDGTTNVLQDVNVRFEAGKSYAVVGASGSGKSTLLNLLMAGYSKYSGEILYDGKELQNIKSESLYELVSIIQQNVFVFNSSIRENITMFREFDEAEVERAISQSGLSEMIANRGEDYKCGENGCGLSGGERQRISIARSLLRKTPVLLVDEATAALDKETAFNITSAILGLKDLTRITVTHALDEVLLKQYDGILVMKNGQVIETGKFDELMREKGYFYSLYTISQ